MPYTGLSFDAPFSGDPDATLPYAGDYDAMEVPGSLMLWEPAHTANPFTGVPAVGAVMPNIMLDRLSEARVAQGLAAATAANAGIVRGGSADIANILQTERSAKGGLHGIITQTNMTSNNQSLVMQGGSDLRGYFNAFPDHSYYVSIWDRVTRVGIASSYPFEMHVLTGNTANVIFFAQQGAIGGGSAGTSRSDPTTPGAVTGVQFRARNTTGSTGTATNNEVAPFIVGCAGPYANNGLTGAGNKSASRVGYRVYIEDLTYSGRSFATVSALDYAAWQTAFGAGGRFAGDTWSDPATVIPS